MHYTTDKGDIGVAVVSADLIKRGLDVLSPLSSSLPFDLVVHRDGKFFKIQVKYRREKNGCVLVGLTRAVISGGRVKKRRIRPDEVDVFAVYCPDTTECYYFGRADVSDVTNVRLRIRPSKNKQKKNVRWASAYRTPVFSE